MQSRYKLIKSVILVVVTLVTIASVYFSKNLKFDYEFESFFPKGDPELKFYLDFRKNFEYDNEFVLIALENSKGIFNKNFLLRLDSLTNSLRKIKNVQKVVSPSNIQNTIITPVGPMQVPYMHINEQEKYEYDSVQVYRSEELTGTFFSKDKKSVSIYVKTKEGISKAASDSLLFALESVIGENKFDKVHVAGKLKAQYVYIQKIQSDFFTFFISSFLLIVIFLFISYRSFWGIWLPMFIVFLSMLWVFGFMGAVHKPLDIMMVILPTMVFIVGMSDVVHIVSKYLEEIKEDKEPFEAIKVTLKDVGLPTFLTLLSTGIGFLTLLYSDITPIRDFGVYTSVGVLVAFILSFTLLPVIMPGIKKVKSFQGNSGRLDWHKQLHTLLLFVLKNRTKIIGGSVVLCLFSFYGISKISVNNNLLEDLVDDDQLKKDFIFFEEQYSGVRPFEMAVWVTDSTKNLFNKEVLEGLDKIEAYLKTTYGVGNILSPLSIVKQATKAINGGYPENYRLPNDTAQLSESLDIIEKIKKRNELKPFISADWKKGRISGRMKDKGSAAIKILNADLEKFMKKNSTTGLLHYKITGTAAMIDRSNELMLYNMLQGILMSILVVSLIIGFYHRSFKMVIISMIPNIVPIIIVGGLMGMLGIELKVSTSIIFSIAFGIATDDTIHLLARFKLELAKGRSFLYALKRTYISTGKAVIVTSLILSGGFLSLIMSDFQSTFYFGLLISLILAIAVITDLLLLPPLLLWLAKSKNN